MKLNIFEGIEVREEDIIQFEKGIFGFEKYLKYILINDTNIENSTELKLLQSIEDENVGFIVVYPYVLDENYEIDLEDDVVDRLNIQSGEEVVLYNVVTIKDDSIKATANMRSPIVINSKNRKAMQIILKNNQWPIKYEFEVNKD